MDVSIKKEYKNEQSYSLEKVNAKFKLYFSFALLVLIPICIFYSMEAFLCNPFEKQNFSIQLLNIFFFEIFTFLGLFMLKKAKYILRLETILFCGLGILNYYMLSFRGTPFMPWDIFSFTTAASVADNYNYSMEPGAFLVIIVFCFLYFMSGLCDISVNSRKQRVSGSIVFLSMIIGYVLYVQSPHALSSFRLYDKLFTPTTMTYRDGTMVALIMQSQYLNVERPEGYSKKQIFRLLSEVGDSEKAIASSDKHQKEYPNIIVIMNEAFSNPGVLGDFTTNKEYMPFLNSVMEGMENTISGYANVSVVGGNTANSEFEFLTSQTLAFLPHGCIPYQQYIKEPTFALPTYLRESGYSTIAIHPYGEKGWQRDEVYPLIGFDKFISLEDFSSPALIRKYVSDEENYNRVIEEYEKHVKDDAPLFLFNVTMQNHSSYSDTFDNFTPEITVDGSDSLPLSNYLSLIKISDREIGKLVSYFSNAPEDTIVLFYGDHQPADSVVSDIWSINGKNPSSLSLEDQRLRYKVPFFLWANFDIKEESNIETSLNYLAPLLADTANLPFVPFYDFLNKTRESYPVISAVQVQDKAGNTYEAKDLKNELKDYSYLQYHLLFDN